MDEPTHNRFTFYVRATDASCAAHANPTATNFTITACASGDQLNDAEGTTSCANLTLDQANTKTPAVCW